VVPNSDGLIAVCAAHGVDAGLCVLPAIRQGDEKRVALSSWKPYQDRLPSREELGAWFGGPSPAMAMCVVCGRVSGNLEMIDFDNWDGGGGVAFETWRQAVESASPGLYARLVVETTPSGGRHVVYRCEAMVAGNQKLAQRRIEAGTREPVVIGAKEYRPRQDPDGRWFAAVTVIETRGEGGLFLCDPSPGYAVTQGKLNEPPVLTQDERDLLIGCAAALDETPRPVVCGPSVKIARQSSGFGSTRPGDDFNDRGDPRDVLQRHGWSIVRGGENEHWRRPGKSRGTSATIKDRVFYVFSSNAEPFEPNKGYSPFAVYAMLEHHGDYTRAATVLASEGYGTRSDPTRGVDLTEFMASIKPRETTAAKPTDGPIPVGELVAAYPRLRKPVVHGLLREGETLNVIASPKVGKSWLTLDLAIAVATGRPWLGRYQTEPGPVLVIDNELHRETSAHRFPKVAGARSVPMREIADRIEIDNFRGKLRDIFALRDYFANMAEKRYKVIILDAFYRFMPVGGDENDNATMANIYNLIDLLADRLGCCFVLIHHSSKGSQSGKSVTDVGAGAGAQSRATDSHLVLRPHNEPGVVVLDAAVRSWPPIEPVCLRWDFPVWHVDESHDPNELKTDKPASKAGKGGSDWTPLRFASAFVAETPRTRTAIIEMAVSAGLSGHMADKLLRQIDRDGLVERTGGETRKDPYKYHTNRGVESS
jgi:hypothetical protein